MNIDTAVIMVAGSGSRMLPATRSVEKCLLPIVSGEKGRRIGIPPVDYAIQDCAAAGLKRVIFVASERGQTQLEDYFGEMNSVLESQLRRVGKNTLIASDKAQRKSHGLEYEYVIQDPDDYGTAIPLFIARNRLAAGEGVVLMNADDVVYNQDGSSDLKRAIDQWKTGETDHVLLGKPIAREDAPRFGIFMQDETGKFLGIDEGPPLSRVPEHPVANIGRYVMTVDEIMPDFINEMYIPRGKGEHKVTEPINEAVTYGQTFHVQEIQGEFLDCGSWDGILAAGQYITEHPQFAVAA